MEETSIDQRLSHVAFIDPRPIEKADVLITGANFFSVDAPATLIPGGVVMPYLERENTQLILIASIDQLIPSFTDFHVINEILSKSSQGFFEILPFNSSKIHLILLDNGRSKMLAKSPQMRLLEAGHPNAFLREQRAQKTPLERLYIDLLHHSNHYDLSRGYLLDGSDKDWYALDLPLEEIVIAWREELAAIEKTESDLIWRTWKSAMLSRKILSRLKYSPINPLKSFYKRGFSSKRSFPKTEKVSFHERWLKERPQQTIKKKITEIPKGQLLVRKPATDGLD